MPVDGLDHVQVAAPPGCEREARQIGSRIRVSFYREGTLLDTVVVTVATP